MSHLRAWVSSLMVNYTWAPSLVCRETAKRSHSVLWLMEGLLTLITTQHSKIMVTPSMLNHWRHQPMYLVTNGDHHKCSKQMHTVKEKCGCQRGASLLETSTARECTQVSYMRCRQTTPTLSTMSSTMHKKTVTIKYSQMIKCQLRRNSWAVAM